MELLEKLTNVLDGFNARMTARKAAEQFTTHPDLELTFSGLILTDSEGTRMVIDMGKCNTFTLKQWNKITQHSDDIR